MMADRQHISHIVDLLVGASIRIDSVVPVRSLEEYFLSLTKEDARA
jgi:hypothetical protein